MTNCLQLSFPDIAEFRLCRPDALVSHELSPPSGSFYHGSLAKYTFDLAPLYCTVLPPYGGEQQSWWRLASVSNVEGYSGLTYFTRGTLRLGGQEGERDRKRNNGVIIGVSRQ